MRCLLPYLLAPLVALGLLEALPRASRLGGQDFSSLWESGRAAMTGQNPYAAYALTLVARWVDMTEVAVNRNTPASLFIYGPLGLLDAMTAMWAWFAICLAIYAVTIVLLFRHYPERLSPLFLAWLLALSPLWHCLLSGQFHTIMSILATAAWLLFKRGNTLAAGIAVGALVAIKPHFTLWLALLFVAGYLRPGFAALASWAAISGAAGLVFGFDLYPRWLKAALETPWLGWPTNITLQALGVRVGQPWVGLVLSVALVACLGWWAFRRRPAAIPLSALSLVGTLLAAPSGWPGYLLVLVPVFFEYGWPAALKAAAVLLLVPASLIWSLSALSPGLLAIFGSLYCAILILVLFGLMQALCQ